MILLQTDLFLEALLVLQTFTTGVEWTQINLCHQQVTGTPSPPDLSKVKPPVLEETSHQAVLHQNGKGLEVHLPAVGPILQHIPIIQSTAKDGIEAPRSKNEVAALKAVVLRDEGHLAGVETDAERTVAAQTYRVQEDLYHRSMSVAFIPRPIDGPVPLIMTITATTDLIIGLTRGTLHGLQTRDTLHPLAGHGMIQR